MVDVGGFFPVPLTSSHVISAVPASPMSPAAWCRASTVRLCCARTRTLTLSWYFYAR